MRQLDGLEDVIEELWHHKLRTLLTLLGMIFGVGAVIAMLSIGEGAEQEAIQLIDSMGLRNVIVNAKALDKEELLEIRERSAGLSLRDVEIASETLPSVTGYSAGKVIHAFITFSEEGQSDATTYGVLPSHFELSRLSLAQGEFFTDRHNRHYEQVAVLGAAAANELFPDGDALHRLIKVNHVWLRVIGILEDKQLRKEEFEGIKLGGERYRIFIPLNTALEKFNRRPLDSELDTFRVTMEPGADPILVARTLSRLLNVRHADVNDFEIVVPAQLMQQDRETRCIFTIEMSCVAGISLLVGGIGIMNIMLATVMERTREIGLMRAVGAKKHHVVRMFLLESLTVSLLGGILGIGLGFSIAKVIAIYADWAMGWSITAILLSVGVCGFVGLVFGYYPARIAADMDPIDAIHRS